MSDVVPFRCPVCQAERFAARGLAGRKARCPECDSLVTVADNSKPAGSSSIDQDADTLTDLPRALFDEIEQESDTVVDESAVSRMPTHGPPPPTSDEHSVVEDRSTDGDFDPYYRWLAIPKGEQPANHYRLLGLQLYESDPDVILISSERQMAHVKAQAGGRNVVIAQRLLSELSLARICLLDAARKSAYDSELRRTLAERAKALTPKTPAGKSTSPASSEAAPTRKAAAGTHATKPEPASREPAPSTPLPPTPPTRQGAPALTSLAGQAPPVQSPWKGSPPPAPPKPEQEEPKERVVFKRRVVEGEMDMTPMIDVTFLLLIFFICTASFALTMTKPIPAPKEDEPSTAAQSIEEFEDDPDYITVRIDAHNTFRVISLDTDEEAPSFQELIVKLRTVRSTGHDGKIPTTLMVIANGQALHEKVVQALDAGTEVGMEKMQLMTVENDDE